MMLVFANDPEKQARQVHVVLEIQLEVTDPVQLRVAQDPLTTTDDGDIQLESRVLEHLISGALTKRLMGDPVARTDFHDGLTISGSTMTRRTYNPETMILEAVTLGAVDASPIPPPPAD